MRTPVVLLHALGLGAAMWDATRRDLLLAGHRVIAPDQRGYGTTPLGTAAPDLDLVADDVARVLDGEGIDGVVLAGSSMGGYVAMSFLRRHADRVRGLALLGTRADADDTEGAAQRRAFADLVTDPTTSTRVIEASVPRLVGATTRAERPHLVEQVYRMAMAVDIEAIAWSQRAIADRPDSFDVLRQVDVPSVVITGDEDELVAAGDSQRMADALPDCRLRMVSGAGHLTPVEAPAVVTAAIEQLHRRTVPTPTTQGPRC
jgi:pimeloyl-ACP methyl ester carboxylesterase